MVAVIAFHVNADWLPGGYLANPEWVAHVQSGAYREWLGKPYAAT